MRRTALSLLLLSLALPLAAFASVAAAQESRPITEADVASRQILSVEFAIAPPAPAFIALVRFTLPPGAAVDSGPIAGPRLFLVESGEVAVGAVDPPDLGFLRAADAPPGAVAGFGPAVILRPGDHFVATGPEPVELRNDGAQAAVFLDTVIVSGSSSAVSPHTSANGVVVDPLVAGVANALPAAPIELRFERLGIATGSEIALPAASGPRLFVVESGTLGLAAVSGEITYSSAAGNNPGSVAGRARTLSPGKETLLTARGSVFAQPDAVGIARNIGRTHLVLLAITILPAGHAKPAGNDSAATPDALDA